MDCGFSGMKQHLAVITFISKDHKPTAEFVLYDNIYSGDIQTAVSH